jgi:hypothetical protein
MIPTEAAQKHQFRYVVNFVLRVYDALWRQIGGRLWGVRW